MVAINQREHHKLLAAFTELEAYLGDSVPHGKQLGELKLMFRSYQQLLSRLAGCIEDYEKLHHHLKVNVLAPQLRQERKKFRQQLDKEDGKKVLGMLPAARAV